MRIKKLNQKGSAVIEGISSLLLTASTLSIFLSISYLGYTKTWINHLAYKGALCLAQQRSKIECRKEAVKLASILSLFGELSYIKFKKTRPILCKFRRRKCYRYTSSLKWTTQQSNSKSNEKWPTNISAIFHINESGYN